jgi:hypothetical protein
MTRGGTRPRRSEPPVIRALDVERLRREAASARPFPHLVLDDFLEEHFALEVEAQFPSFEEARRLGRGFSAVNERNKYQVTDAALFPPAIAKLHQALAAPEWLATVSEIMGIPDLVADPELVGGGMHQTGPCGHLDVHVDFNYLAGRGLYRRLNILLYFNREWPDAWGGRVELWDPKVRRCEHSVAPIFNRCVIFATSESSCHGVTAVTCPEGRSRKSFAAYYYNQTPPPDFAGRTHSTVFWARPDERMKRFVWMPVERARKGIERSARRLRRALKARRGKGDSRDRE